MKQVLDFMIIGAQKSGTTTLFALLKQHKDIYMPPEKELPFFGAKRESIGWSRYIEEYFRENDLAEEKLWGTATPQYMSSEEFAEKIYHVSPDIKLIAILRNPLERAYSHYQMSKKREKEKRSFEEALKELSTDEAIAFARNNPTEENAYFVWGEYGRILNSYLKFFERNQILLLSTDELEKEPQKVIDKICGFLTLETYTPKDLEKKFHVGGEKRKMPFVDKIIKNNSIKKISKKLFNNKLEKKIKLWLYWIDQWNTKKTGKKKDTPHIYPSKLIDMYVKDSDILENNFGFIAPWKKELLKKLKHKHT